MKEKFLYFIIGLLLGGIIATGIFMIINKNNSNNSNNGNFGPGQRTFNGGNYTGSGRINQNMMNSLPSQTLDNGSIQYTMPDGSTIVRNPNQRWW